MILIKIYFKSHSFRTKIQQSRIRETMLISSTLNMIGKQLDQMALYVSIRFEIVFRQHYTTINFIILFPFYEIRIISWI